MRVAPVTPGEQASARSTAAGSTVSGAPGVSTGANAASVTGPAAVAGPALAPVPSSAAVSSATTRPLVSIAAVYGRGDRSRPGRRVPARPIAAPRRVRARTPVVDALAGIVLACLLVVVVARALGGLLERFGQPRVMGEVLAGLVLGASLLGLAPGDPSAAIFTDDARDVMKAAGLVGVVAYLGAVGASLDLTALRRDRRAATSVALASFALPFAAGAALALALHGEVSGDPPLAAFALFVGTAIAVTAFPVLARIVDARGLGDRLPGRVALAAAAAQEALVWPALAIAVTVSGRDGGVGGGPAGTLAAAVAGVLVVVALARVLAPVVLRAASAPAGRFGVLVAGLGLAAAVTEVTGLHPVAGAFLYGLVLPAGPRAELAADLRSRRAVVALAVLLPLYFAVPALRLDVTTLGSDGLGMLALVLVVAVAAKLLTATAAAAWAGLSRSDALTVGVLMNARGLVEILVLTVGLDAGLIDERLFAVFVLVALITTFATGPLLGRVPQDPPSPPAAEPPVARPRRALAGRR
ncbi:cation/H(+) antiporter [Conexibacter sp. W3-3-2]|nr:cation/H(+) antiporter [Conexibacter sp. W3-3-2]